MEDNFKHGFLFFFEDADPAYCAEDMVKLVENIKNKNGPINYIIVLYDEDCICFFNPYDIYTYVCSCSYRTDFSVIRNGKPVLVTKSELQPGEVGRLILDYSTERFIDSELPYMIQHSNGGEILSDIIGMN